MQLRRKGGFRRRFWRGTQWETPGNLIFPGFIGLAVFSLEPSAVHHVPTEIDLGNFPDFPGISRGYMGGRGGFSSGELGVQSEELEMMKGELRNRGRCPGGVVESRQLQFVRLPFPAASQSVAVSSTYNSDPVKPFRACGQAWRRGKTDEEI